MAKGTVTRKQLLKEPDQFITFSGKLIAFGRSHLKAILMVSGGILALLVVAVAVRQVSDRNENKASELVRQAMSKYSAVLQDTDAATAYERVKPDFSDIFDRFGSKHAARVARVVFGDISYAAGDADSAIAMYQRALEDVGRNASLKNIVLSGLGHAYALKGSQAESMRYFEMIAQDDEKLMKDGALFNLAGLYADAGEKEKSHASYERLLVEFPDSMYADVAREKISG